MTTDQQFESMSPEEMVRAIAPLPHDATEYSVGGVKVVGARQANIPLPSGGGGGDASSRQAIDSIVAALIAHGLTLRIY
jgi:hypothetical protein